MTQFYLDTYKTTKSFDTAIQSLLNLGFMIDYFSEKGYYLKAGTLAEEIKNFPHPAKHFLVRELCRIEMRAVYNLLRQNDKSAIHVPETSLPTLKQIPISYPPRPICAG